MGGLGKRGRVPQKKGGAMGELPVGDAEDIAKAGAAHQM